MADEESGQELGLETQGQASYEQWLRERPVDWLLADYQKAHAFLMNSVRRGEKTPAQAQQELAAMRQNMLAQRPDLAGKVRDVPLAEFAARDGSTPATRAGYGNANPLGNLNNGIPSPPPASAPPAGPQQPAPFNPFAPGERQAFAGRKLDDIKAGGGFASMTPQEMEYYLGGLPTGDPLAASAFLGLNGINTGSGNPWAETAESFIQPAAMAAAMQLYGGNAGTTALGETGTGQLAKNMQDRFAGGHASFFDPESARSFIDSTADMVDRYSNKADSVGPNQGAVAAFLNEKPDNAFNAWMDVQGMNLNPFMRFGGVRSGLQKSLYKQYYQQQAPENKNQNYWRFLANVGR